MKGLILRLVRGVFLSVVGVLVLALLAEQVARWSAERSFSEPPGATHDVGGRQAHIYCVGEGQPTVILEAGLDGAGSNTWAGILPELGQASRVCAYDRAGVMWSEPGPLPRDGGRIADELHALLSAANEAPPYVLVGHSLGGPLAMLYHERFPDEVAGMVLVDPTSPQVFDRLPAPFNAGPPPKALFQALAAVGVLRLQTTFMNPPRLPEPARGAAVGLGPTRLQGVMGELQSLSDIIAAAGRVASLGDRPMVVLTGGATTEPSFMLPEEAAVEKDRIWPELHAEMANLSTESDHRIISEAGHYIQYDAPEAVIQAVKDVLGAVRDGESLGESGVAGDSVE